METVYIATNKLPGALGVALHYGEVSTRDIAFKAADRAYASSGGAGQRAWLVIIPNLANAEGSRSMRGAFGGPNPFEKHEIDTYARDGIDVPEHGAIMTGTGCYSVCYVRPATLAKLLAPDHPATMVALDAMGSDQPELARAVASEALQAHAEKNRVSNAIRWTLYVFKGFKSSYRADALRELARETQGNAGTLEMIDELVSRGYLKRNAGGAIQITTEGKNLARERPYGVREQLPTLAKEIA